MRFEDHFSAHAALYAQFRPGYPAALFAWLAAQCAAHELAVDCGTGSGQAARRLAPYFRRVIAVDPSLQQLRHAAPSPHVFYAGSLAEKLPLRDACADLLTVAQAVHWMNQDALWPEVQRVLTAGGVCAVWSYNRVRVFAEIDQIMERYHDQIVGDYWPAGRRVLEQIRQTLRFPFAELEPPKLRMRQNWNFAQFLGYVQSWSATQRYLKARGENPLHFISAELRDAWGSPEARRPVTWSLFIRAGRRA